MNECNFSWFHGFPDYFFAVPLSIEAMAPEWAIVRVSLVITFAVYTLEGVGAWFSLFGF